LFFLGLLGSVLSYFHAGKGYAGIQGVFFALGQLVLFYCVTRILIAFWFCAAKRYSGEAARMRETLRDSRKRFWNYILIYFLLQIILAVAMPVYACSPDCPVMSSSDWGRPCFSV
jgi:glycerol-3-phosphate acyltransferase PlsY